MTPLELQLIAALREAVKTLYNCRYSEQPLAKELDALLKEITGKSQADLAFDWMAERINRNEVKVGLIPLLCGAPILQNTDPD